MQKNGNLTKEKSGFDAGNDLVSTCCFVSSVSGYGSGVSGAEVGSSMVLDTQQSCNKN